MTVSDPASVPGQPFDDGPATPPPGDGPTAIGEGRVTTRAKGELERARDIRLGPWQSALVGVAIGWGAVALKAALNEVSGSETGYIVFMAASVVAAWFGGLAGGVVATGTVLVLNEIVFIAALPPDTSQQGVLVRQLLYLVVASGTVLLIATRRAASDRLSDALAEVATLADEVQARDERLELMLSASGTGFWEWDVRSGRLVWSDEIFRQHGLDPAAGAEPAFDDYLGSVHPDDRERFRRGIAAAITGGPDFRLEFRVVWPDGSEHWIQGAGRVFRDDRGTAVRMVGTGQDITARHRLEAERDALLVEERQAGEFREAFIDVISHELRTPITTILGLAQILTRPGRVDDPEQRQAMLQDVRAESERLHRLVEDLLVLSRVERGRLPVDLEPIQPGRLLQRLVAAEATQLPTIEIELVLADDLPVVNAEATYIEQVMRNLLGNAAKYTPPGTPVLVTADAVGDDLRVRVIDRGPGVPHASWANLFDLFYRDPDSARTVAGSGIGLFVCASLIEGMGGRIWVADAPEGGAEFGFTLPKTDVDDDARPADRNPVRLGS